MRTRRIGSLSVSVAGLGTNNFGPRCDAGEAAAVVGAALDAGITLLDTANIYGDGASEEYIGRALGRRRDEVVIATKVGMQMHDRTTGDALPGERGGAPAYVIRACEESLRRLGTDRIDLYQLHEPDPDTPVAETLAALDRLVSEGKVREIGCSNFSGEQIGEAEAAARASGRSRFVCAQNHLSLLERDALQGVLPACERHGLALLPFFPLARGLLTGKYRRGDAPPEGTRLAAYPQQRREALMTAETFDRLDRLSAWAAERGRSLLDLAFAWLLAHDPVASVIAGATTPEQVRANAAAASWELSAAERDEISALAS